ncbi:hypothetical protein A3J56_01145 [Candidatus Giovannonibacteria bacterium RIFCSPHIGHO2_02_FULL_46_20]|uniref:Uncharacterized protein n=1 Tax=Candidatus Giovannonibacteria bacterium RIFCSPHIGHO2_02_FULL_46_20 TaxID=1798338 RepID=A0A1F5WFZ9_9BACT|nr:MAG: hypothetical protein A3J56_01145 [Candidatus Giovannonibacteria bacterium RIFCSPHIGHO2_02_FULL_46_20]
MLLVVPSAVVPQEGFPVVAPFAVPFVAVHPVELPLKFQLTVLFKAKTDSIFGGILGFCQIGGHPEKIQEKIKIVTRKNLETFKNALF